MRTERLALLAALLAACSSDPTAPPTPDVAPTPDAAEDVADDAPAEDASDDAAEDAAQDTPADVAPDAPRDASRDAAPDAPAPDAAPDVALDVAPDLTAPDVTAPDAAPDASIDAPPDAAVDAPADRTVVVDARDAAPDAAPDVAPMDAPADRPADVPADAPADVAPDAPCVAPRRVCDGACRDLATDTDHCGACGVRCSGVCSGGACVALRVAQLSAGDGITCARLADGTARCWGDNEYGQVGDGTAGRLLGRPRPTPVAGLAGVAEVHAGGWHTCARLADGTARCWGNNGSGQLGVAPPGEARPTPQTVTGLTNVVSLAVGNFHTCAARSDGTVYCWGINSAGHLGVGTSGASASTPTRVPGLTDVTAVAVGNSQTCALHRDGGVSCWGRNNQGQTAAGASLTTVLSPTRVAGLANVAGLALGAFHSCAWLADGTARCWGDNSSGQAGDGAPSTPRHAPVVVAGVTGVVGMSAGSNHTCAWTRGGSHYCWGSNASGQLGGDRMGGVRPAPAAIPDLGAVEEMAAGEGHTCARLATGAVRCWGADGAGQLGDDARYAGHRTPAPVPGLAGVAQVAAGGDSTCARMTDGTARCWGQGGQGQLGVGDAPGVSRLVPVAVTGLANATALALGSFHACARLGDGTARCWGYNIDGQLGTGNTTSSSTPVAVTRITGVAALSAGQTFTCALLAGRTATCWGSNNNGRLGIGYHDTFPHEYPGAPVMRLTDATGLGLGLFHACAVTAGAAASCWGANDNGQLGDGTTMPRYVATPVPALRDVRSVAGGYHHACALTGDGAVWCWGDNRAGQLGLGDTTSPRTSPARVPGIAPAVEVVAGDFHTCARLADGTARCWGNNDYGQVGDDTQLTARTSPVAVPGLANAAGLAAGSGHTCARVADGTARCWGRDGSGQMGLGSLRTPRW